MAERDREFFLRSQVPIGMAPNRAAEVIAYLSAATTQADWLQCIKTFAESSIGDVLGQVCTPTLVTCPRSAYTSEVDCIEVAARIPGARLAMFDEGSAYPSGDPARALELVEAFLGSLTPPEGRSVPNAKSLRELEVLRLLSAGRSNQQIADDLVISLNIVRRHVSNIFDKTGVANRAQAALYARDIAHG